MRTIILIILISFLSATVTAQDRNLTRIRQDDHQIQEMNKQITKLKTPLIRKSPGHYTKEQWRQLIDSTWGQGISTSDKLNIFDNFWTFVDQKWGGFPNLIVNWDSLKDAYRPEIAAGVSRGRFDGILSRLSRALNEWHAFTFDMGIDSSSGYYSTTDPEYPNFPSFHYQPGLPIIMVNTLGFRTNFGAGLTPLPDSTALVYNVMANHPLGLQPGDIVLGYDGIPWIKLFNELLEAELPIFEGGRYLGSTPDASLYATIISAGMNWGLFDTIDIKKYPTNEIVHYPTSLLESIQPPYFLSTEQLPVNGVPFPDIQNKKMVSWGVVDGTSIGYIYVWDWWGGVPDQTGVLFTKAIDELMHKYNINGLIIDFRNNQGGTPNYANGGFSQLFNFDPLSNYSMARRKAGNNHIAFSIVPYNNELMGPFTPTCEIFDHPIAVLTNPTCGSAGDYNTNRIRFHPMVRIFGLPTNGAYTAFADYNDWDYGNWKNSYHYRIDHSSLYSNHANEGYLIHKPFPVDEEVWLTPDGVAKGEDDVVNAAMNWMNNLVYGHDLTKNAGYCHPGTDTLKISAMVENPNSHQTSSKIYIKNLEGSFIDSLELNKAGLSDKSEIWNGNYAAPYSEDFFSISLNANDIDESKTWTTDNISRFTTAGPLTVDSIEYKQMGNFNIYNLRLFVRNWSSTSTIQGCKINISSDDPWVKSVTGVNVPDMPPDTIVGSSNWSLIRYDSTFKNSFNLKFEIMSEGWTYWTDSMHVIISPTGINEQANQPLTFNLEQNYPNPFNPTTNIKYSIASSQFVELKIFNILGQEIETLVNAEKPAGNYQVEFNAADLPSGVYFYRIQASSFNQVRKMLLIK